MSVAATRRAAKRIRRQYGTPFKGKTSREQRAAKAEKLKKTG
jgi:hypothetical protein